MTDFKTKLNENLIERFQDFNIPTEVLQIIFDPFSIGVKTDVCVKAKEVMPCIDEGILQMEIMDMQSSFALKQHIKCDRAEDFTLKMVLVIQCLDRFYTCESSFTHINAIETKRCFFLTNKLHEYLRIAPTSYGPNYTGIVKSRLLVAQLVALLPCSKKVLGSTPGLGSFCMEFACSHHAYMGSLRVLRLPLTVQKHGC
ncbi:hypothetical protein AMECASPLE_037912 [Ameca splendens]|uniref:Uncharacterized protein n=1 Tax=Ameca splendens TaxID=208324 RepID=A0ABV0YV56_9TELE